MKTIFCRGIVAVAGIAALLLTVELADGGRRGGGGGRAGGGGGGRVGGGGGVSRPSAPVSRPSAPVSRPSGGGGANISRPSTPINRSPSVSNPINRPNIGGGGNIGGGNLGHRDGPGIVNSPGLNPGNRPSIGSGPSIGPGKGINPNIANRPSIGSGGIANRPGQLPANRPGTPGNRPGAGNLLPGLGGAYAGAKIGDHLGRRQEGVADRRANVADRSNNLNDRMNQRQDYRNQRQDQRQDYLGDRREDWQNWSDDYHGHHYGWYHGGWCNHWGNTWQHMWSDHTAAMVLGTTMWGLNRMNYWFGYAPYYNPYYSEPLVIDNTTIYYSEPMAAPPVEINIVETPKENALPPGVTEDGMKNFDAARVSFYEGDFKEALKLTNKALASMPKDAVIHEFRALCLFSMGDYKEAAAALHPVLAVGPGWDWTTMSGLYPGNYTQYFRKLESYVTANPKSAEGHFVLAYHYMTLGHTDNAVAEYKDVLKLKPNDSVSAQMLQMLGKSAKPADPVVESDIKIDPASVVGTWTSSRGGKATFEMTLGNDKSFTWSYREGKSKQDVKGAYALNGNVLALEPDAGGVMLAEITEPKSGTFTFRVVGEPKSDPGLTFKAK